MIGYLALARRKTLRGLITIAGYRLFNPVRDKLDSLVLGDPNAGDLGLGA